MFKRFNLISQLTKIVPKQFQAPNTVRSLVISTLQRKEQSSKINSTYWIPLICGLFLGTSISLTDEATSTAGDTKRSPSRLRRSNTNLSGVDTILQHYEYRLRENASLEKIFKYFTSVVVNGRHYMTPLDMVRSITPGVPPSDSSKPLNVPIHQSKLSQLGHFSETEVPSFFRLGPDDPGLVSYGRFLIYVTLLAIPAQELESAYRMSCGYDFKTPKLQGDRLSVHNFDFIMLRNVKVRGQGYSTKHSRKSFVRYLFGSDLEGTLTFEQFRNFHEDLRKEVLKMEYFLLSDCESKDGEPLMSLPAFAKSVAALVPSDYRSKFLDRAKTMGKAELHPDILSKDPSKHGHGKSLEVQTSIPANECFVTLEDYSKWKEVLKQLTEMEHAIRKYSYTDGHFTPTNLKRSARAVVKVKLSKKITWCLFYLFDIDGDGELHHNDFVRLLKPHAAATNPTIEPEGLGLDLFFKCTYKSCSECYREWYDGTMDPAKCDLESE